MKYSQIQRNQTTQSKRSIVKEEITGVFREYPEATENENTTTETYDAAKAVVEVNLLL